MPLQRTYLTDRRSFYLKIYGMSVEVSAQDEVGASITQTSAKTSSANVFFLKTFLRTITVLGA